MIWQSCWRNAAKYVLKSNDLSVPARHNELLTEQLICSILRLFRIKNSLVRLVPSSSANTLDNSQ